MARASRVSLKVKAHSEMVIKPMTSKDVHQAFAIHQSVQYQPWSKVVFEDCLTTPYQGWALFHNEQIVGYAILLIVLDEVTLMEIAISPALQGQGLGGYLLTDILRECQRQNMHSCFLEVRVSNQKAISLYQSLGFKLLESRKDYYPTANGREDALMMAKQFSPE